MKTNKYSRSVIFVLVTISVFLLSAKFAEDWVISSWHYDDSWLVELTGYKEMPSAEEGGSRDPNWDITRYKLILSFLTGENTGKTLPVEVEQLTGSYLSFEKGKKYILNVDRFDDGKDLYSLSDVFRFPLVVAFIITTALIVCLIGGKSGTRAILSLLLSLLVLVRWALPRILRGGSPVITAVLAVSVISAVTTVFVMKDRKNWPVAFLGAVGGTAAASILGWAAIKIWQLTGITSEGAPLLAGIMPGISLKGILLASVIIGAIGAVLDVSVSITSAMSEMYEYDRNIEESRLLRAGLSVGQDILGSMINTLILAYFGSSLVVSLLIGHHAPVFWSILNDPMISSEIVRSLAGTAGLMLTIPLTALIGSVWIGRTRE